MLAIPSLAYQVIYWAFLVATLVALVHAGTKRGDAFPAIGRLTKPMWLGILAASLVVQLLFPFGILGIAAFVATLVYLVDTRRKLDEITRGPRY